MLSKPLISGLSSKTSDFILLSLVTLMYIALCAEADMYVPAFPQMISYFGVAENKIQLILSINFGALCFTGLVTGPLSDSFGRRPILIWGLALFVLSSLGCCYSADFYTMLFWRFLQGVGASVPMVVGIATFLDKYSQEKAGKIIGMLNGVISASMAGAPIVGVWISEIWNWRANFFIIFLLALLTFLGTWLFIEETLPAQNRKPFKWKSLSSDYARLMKSFEFIAYSTIAISAFTAIVVYIANLSVIFVNHMGMNLATFSYWQATTMCTFIVCSLLSTKLIEKKGLEYSQNLGSLISLSGVAGLFYVGHILPHNVPLICFTMALVAAGGAFFCAPFGLKAMSLFPDIRGAACALQTAVRQSLAAGCVIISEVLFDGSITPVATIIFALGAVCTILYGIIYLKQKKTTKFRKHKLRA